MTSTKKLWNRDNLLVGLVIIGLVVAVIASVYAYGGNARSKDRDERNFDCLTAYVSTQQQNSAPATLANRVQSAAWRDYERGFSDDPDAKGLDKAELKARWLTLYKVYEELQVDPLPDLRQFCDSYKDGDQ